MTIYTQTARFDTGRALTEDELFRLAPSIFATEAHVSRSERFQPIPTIEVLRGLANEGFMPVGAKQSGCRDESREGHTKHLIRLRRMENETAHQVGDTVCEILLKNANDGTSAYELMAGLFRIRCLNSLVAQESTLESIKVRHSGDVGHKVIEGTYTVLEEAKKALVAPAEWSTLNLSQDERNVLAESAIMARFGDAAGNVSSPVKPEHMLSPRRRDDTATDLWMTFNVLQENAIRGRIRAWGRDGNNQPRRVTTRPVKGIDQDVKLNRALWHLTQRMAELKGWKSS